MTPTPRSPKVVGLPRSRVRTLRDGKALVVTEGGEPLVFNADGSLADVQLVYSAPDDDAG